MNEKLLLSVPEAAKLLGLSPRRLYALIAEHQVPEGIVIHLGRSVRLSRARLLSWLGATDMNTHSSESSPDPRSGTSRVTSE